MSLQSIDPANGDVVASYEAASLDDARKVLADVHSCFASWRMTTGSERSTRLLALASILRERVENYADLMAREMGKTLREGRAEIEKCATTCEFYAEHGAAMLARDPVHTDFERSFVSFEPLGVVLGIMPWNFPFWQVIRYAVPTLTAGNTTLVKPAPNVCGCAQALERAFADAGFPRGALRVVLVADDEITGQLIDDVRVAAVTLTGSTRAGRIVAARAGAALKKTVLELGGSDPYVILDDADLDVAVSACVTARLMNAGQSCIGAKRFIVTPFLRDEFERRFTMHMAHRVVAAPQREDADVGPLARMDLRDTLHKQVVDSVAKGARLLTGGECPSSGGAFYPPTVLTDVGPGMPAYDEELFGPVAAIIPADDEYDAIRIANDTVYGLGAAIFTNDIARGERLAVQQIQAGAVFINDHVRSDPRMPFGGIKSSGYGRELGSLGIHEFVNAKTICLTVV